MGEGLWRKLGGSAWEVFSAGSHPAGFVQPLAIQVMQEVGIDLGNARSKPAEVFVGQPFDLVVTVCDRARETCPAFPGAAARVHWPFEDPSDAPGSAAERLAEFRRVRDRIEARIRRYLETGA
ncbi:MAG: arsenate reductase ArsC [Planctomycetes bacterium]|nr:arsenate reductase ArsC [Planctomycetota bacterium]